MRKPVRWLVGAALLALGGWWLAAAWPAEDHLDPLKVASDTHSLIFENKFVRVIQAKVPPGKVEPKHRHPHGVTISLADYDVEQKTFPDGKVAKLHRSFGLASWAEAQVHEIKNVGKTGLHSIRVELKF